MKERGVDIQPGRNAKPVADLLEGLPLAFLGALAVIDVQGGSVACAEISEGQRGADSGVHASAKDDQHARFGLFAGKKVLAIREGASGET